MESSDEANSYVLFELAGALYGVRSADVVQLEMVNSITPVPNAPQFVRGVVSVRGSVIPVVDLRARFSFDTVSQGLRTRLLIVRSEQRMVALMVDTAREFARIDEDAIAPPPDSVSGLSGKYLRGIATHADRIILVLDIAELLDARFDIEMIQETDTAVQENVP
jgi:purine-binding chemotaxis protein CheW